MADIARLVAALELESSKFHKEIDRVNNTLNRLEKNAKKRFDGVSSAFKKFVGLAAVIGGVKSLGTAIAGLAQEADHLKDLSSQVDVSVESLSTLGKAAAQFGIEAGGLEQALKKLSVSIANVAGGNKEITQAFEAIGVSVRDSNGNLKGTEKTLLDLADAFKGLPDGPLKTAKAIQIFGKAGADLIPFLNEGAEGIEKLREAIRRFGGEISGDTAKKADDFGDALSNLGTTFGGIGRAILDDALPPLKEFLELLTSGAKIVLDWIDTTPQERVKELTREIEILQQKMAVSPDFMDKIFIARLKEANDELAETKKLVNDIAFGGGPVGSLLTGLTNELNAAGVKAQEIEQKRIDDEQKAKDEAEAEAKRRQKEAIADMQRTREVAGQVAVRLVQQQAQEETAALDIANKNNLISFADYYNKRAEIQRKSIDAEIAAQQKLLGTDIKGSERVQILGEIEVLKRQRDAITTQTVASIAESEQQIAESLRDIRADLLEIQGDEVGAATIRLQAQYEDLLERLKAESNTAGIEIVNALFNERLVSEQLSKIQSDYSEFSSRLSAQQDVIQAQQETGLLSERQARKEIIKLQKAALPELQKLIEAQRILAMETANPAAHNALLQLEADYIRLANVGNETALQIKDAFESGVIAALQEVAPTIETGIKAFDKFANTVIQRINDIAAEITAQALGDLLFGAFGGFGGGGGAAGSAGGLASLAGLLIPRAGGGPVYAGGGYVVGEDGPELFSPSNNGRIIPNDELGMGRSVVVNINVSAPNGRLSQESIDQVATRGGLAVRRAMARNS